jgi:hypothetical protein
MCDLEVDGYGTELRDTQHTARKQHRCEECGRTIKPGDRYGTFTGLYEGDFFMVKHCLRCTKARHWLGKRGHGWEGGQILEWVRICVETDGEEILAEARKKREQP